MGTVYNIARGVQFFAPILVSQVVILYGLSGGLSVPLLLALATATWVWTLPETRARDLKAIPTAASHPIPIAATAPTRDTGQRL